MKKIHELHYELDYIVDYYKELSNYKNFSVIGMSKQHDWLNYFFPNKNYTTLNAYPEDAAPTIHKYFFKNAPLSASDMTHNCAIINFMIAKDSSTPIFVVLMANKDNKANFEYAYNAFFLCENADKIFSHPKYDYNLMKMIYFIVSAYQRAKIPIYSKYPNVIDLLLTNYETNLYTVDELNRRITSMILQEEALSISLEQTKREGIKETSDSVKKPIILDDEDTKIELSDNVTIYDMEQNFDEFLNNRIEQLNKQIEEEIKKKQEANKPKKQKINVNGEMLKAKIGEDSDIVSVAKAWEAKIDAENAWKKENIYRDRFRVSPVFKQDKYLDENKKLEIIEDERSIEPFEPYNDDKKLESMISKKWL